ncbi:MAG: type II secretion system F family protein, partial [Armatimonadetes bacterium]|nr:type II secretion system F family protein [Armatimonadota bacterium]
MPHYWFTDPTGRARRMMARDLPHAVERAQQALGGPWRVGQPMQAVALSSSEKMWLWRQLASAVAERAPLPQALSHIGQSAATGPARVAATRLAQLCAEGLSLAEALAAVPGVASRDELKFIAGAERLGRLPDAAEAMARLSELDNNTLADLAMRWIYPAFTAAVGLVALPVVAVLLHRFGHFPQPLSFADLGVSPHRSLAATAWGVAAYVPAVLLLLTVVAGAIAVIARWAGWSASPLWDRLLYSIPGYGSVVFHRRLGLFFEAIALGRRANLPDTQVMSLAIPVLGPSLHVA